MNGTCLRNNPYECYSLRMLPYRLDLVNASLRDRIVVSLYSQRADSVAELARRLEVLRPSCSRALHALKAQDIVDRSGRRWELTKTGRQTARSLLKDVPKNMEETLTTLNRAITGLEVTQLVGGGAFPQATGQFGGLQIMAEQFERQRQEIVRNFVGALEPQRITQDLAKTAIAGLNQQLLGDLSNSLQVYVSQLVKSSGLDRAISAVAESQRAHLALLGTSSSILASLGPLLSQNLVPLSQIRADLMVLAGVAGTITANRTFLQPLISSAAEVVTAHQSYIDDLLDGFRHPDSLNWDTERTGFGSVFQEIFAPSYTTSRFVTGAREVIDVSDTDLDIQQQDHSLASRRALTLEAELAGLGPRFVAMWRGLWVAFYSDSPDAIRQAMHSGRELLRQVLNVLAPDDLFAAGEKLTRERRAEFVLAPLSRSGSNWAKVTATNIDLAYSLFCGDAHWEKDEPRFGREGFVALLESLGAFLRLLIACHRDGRKTPE